MLAAMSDILASTRPFEELLGQVTGAAIELTGASGAVVELVDGDALEYVATAGSVAACRGMRLARATSLSGLCVDSSELQYARDTATDPRVDRAACERIGARSMMVVPLAHGTDMFGVLKVVSDRADAFGGMDARVLRLAAGIVAGALARQRSIERHEALGREYAAVSARMASAMAASPTAMMIHDLDGIIEVWNPAAERLLGWPAADCIGRFPPYLSDEEVAQFHDLTRRVLWSGSLESMLRVRSNRAGRKLYLRVSAAPVMDGQGAIVAIVRTFEDITTELAQAEAQRSAAERVRRVIERSLDGFVSLDATGLVTEWNPAAERLFGWMRAEALGRPLDALVAPHPGDDPAGSLGQVLLAGAGDPDGRRLEVLARRRDGAPLAIEVSVTASRIDGKDVFDAFITDISERRAERESLRTQALRDALTGLPNRAAFDARVAAAVERHRGSPNRMAVLFVDLDGFKPVNDTHGHEAGDDVLRTLAARMTRCVRASDFVARLAGDEFVVVLEDMQDAVANVEHVAGKLLEALSRPIEVGAVQVTVGASIGVAVLGPDDYGVAELVRRADRAMYQVKRQGGVGWRLASG